MDPVEYKDEIADFSMNKVQAAISYRDSVDINDNYYNSSKLVVYIPKEKELEMESYKQMKQLQKKEITLDEIVAQKMREAVGKTVGRTDKVEQELISEQENIKEGEEYGEN